MAEQDKIPLKQGESLTVKLKVRDVETNLIIDYSVGFTARMQIRQDADDIVRDDLQTDDLTANDGRIVLGDGVPPTGSIETDVANVVLSWDTAAAAALDLFTGRGVQDTYQGIGDLEISDLSGEVVTSVRLVFEQTREVTL